MSAKKSLIFTKFNRDADVTNHVSTFLDFKDLMSLSSASRDIRALFKNAKNKKMAALLLKEVLLAENPEKISRLLTSCSCPESIITRIQGNEGYWNTSAFRDTQELRMEYKRRWKNISPLEAAAWCGDNFIVNLLVQYLPVYLHSIAQSQLQNMLKRTDSQENGRYLAPLKTLLNEYKEMHELRDASIKIKDEKLKKIKKLHFSLSNHILQIYNTKFWECYQPGSVNNRLAFLPVRDRKSMTKFLKEEPLRNMLNSDSFKLNAFFVEKTLFITIGDFKVNAYEFVQMISEIKTKELQEIIEYLNPMPVSGRYACTIL